MRLSQRRGSPHGNALNVYGCVGDGLFHAADKRLFKNVGEPLGRRCSVVRLLQLPAGFTSRSGSHPHGPPGRRWAVRELLEAA